MADAGIVALDPPRLAVLEAFLRDAGALCTRASGDVVGELAGTGEAVPPAVGELRALAEWCGVQADGVRWRRRAVEALPAALPLPAWPPGPPALARSRAEVWAPRLVAALAGSPPDWDVLAPVLAEVARGLGDPVFVRRLGRLVGPDALLLLPLDVEAAGVAATAPEAEVEAARTVVGDLLAGVEPPEDDPSPAWAAVEGLAHAPGEAVLRQVEERADDWGLATDVLGGVVGLVRVGRGAPLPGVGPLAVAGLAADVAGLAADDADELDVLSTLASGLRLAAPLLGPWAGVAYGGAVLLGLVAWAAAHDMPDDERDVRRDDTGTGVRRYPSGSPSNTNVDTAGVPLDPAFR
ncbi:hypothetical protein PO878_07560 [Iamia majanohamensis]|uniref:Uncharacterized protein n=1 Tax=Iamia majanohamensis TaxID=467976 RepID=A0AAE9Y862_9ACTN|nr:hypothetical protein [Iamia majanohamensis]WCO68584.1 hypothetical protein PO878_07560 [Iamia majanohamensis]